MLDPKIVEELGAKFSALLAATPAGDIEKNARALLSSGLSRLNLVTREEFDIQRELLSRAMARLDALEARLAELEARPANSQTS